MGQLESWLVAREAMLAQAEMGDSVDAVDELIRKHEDFEKTVIAQGEKFRNIQRLTMVGVKVKVKVDF
jgi:hypothetical protein